MWPRVITIFFLIFSLFIASTTTINAVCVNNSQCPVGQWCNVYTGQCTLNTPTPTKRMYPAKGSCPVDNQVETAIGCVSTDASGPDSFFSSIIKIAVGLGGGLALLLMLYGTFIITTSAGIPDKLKEGKEILTSAISGLVFIILSVVLLNLIGIQILGLPGLQ